MKRLALAIAAAACHPAVPVRRAPPPVDESDATPRLPPLPGPPAGPHLHWRLARVEDNRVGLAEMTWSEHGETAVWTRKPPGRLARLSMCCWDGEDDRGLDWLAPMVLDDVIVLEAEGQLWVLARRDGATLFDWSDNRTSQQRLRVGLDGAIADDGKLEITVDGETCSSELHGQAFVRPCGRYLVYFDRGLLALFEHDPYLLVATRPVRSPLPPCGSATVDRTEAIGLAQVRVIGQRTTTCMD